MGTEVKFVDLLGGVFFALKIVIVVKYTLAFTILVILRVEFSGMKYSRAVGHHPFLELAHPEQKLYSFNTYFLFFPLPL